MSDPDHDDDDEDHDIVFQITAGDILNRLIIEWKQHDVIQLHDLATETVSNVRQVIIEIGKRSLLPQTRTIKLEDQKQLAAIWKELAEAVEVENQTLAEKEQLQNPGDIEYAFEAGEHRPSRFIIWACTPTYKFDVHYTKINLAIFYCSPKNGEDSSSDSDSAHTTQFSKRKPVSEQIHAAEEQGRRAARKDGRRARGKPRQLGIRTRPSGPVARLPGVRGKIGKLTSNDSRGRHGQADADETREELQQTEIEETEIDPVSASDSSISDLADSDPEQHRKSRSHKENVAWIREMVLEDRQTRVAADNTQSVADGSSVSDDHTQSQQLWLSSNKKTTPALDVASEIHKAVKWCLEPLEPSQTPLFHKRVVGTIHWPAKFVKKCTDLQRRLQELRSGSRKYDVVKKDTELGSQRLEAIRTEEVAQRLPALVLVATDLNRLDDVDQMHQDAELHRMLMEVREFLNNIIDELVDREEDVNAALHQGRSPS